jgi:cytochrome c biogenesis protein CcmG, thiol:disulfide interchange protein DsbE
MSPETEPPRTRNLLIFLGGMLFLGIALSLILFGGELLGQNTAVSSSSSSDPNNAIPTFTFAEMPPQARIGNVEVGQQAPDFQLISLTGETVSLADYEGQPIILNFWATWCPPCRAEMPALEEAYQAYQDEGLVVLALNREESPQTVAAFWQEMTDRGTPLTFAPLLDETGEVGAAYGVFNMPTTYFVSPTGEITAVHRGLLTPEQINQYLQPLLTNS